MLSRYKMGTTKNGTTSEYITFPMKSIKPTLLCKDYSFSLYFPQVLPLATEVVRWFDMKPLEILWDNFLSREHTLLCYGSCIALRYSILHAGRLMHFLEQPPPSWKVRSFFYPAFVFDVTCSLELGSIHSDYLR